MMENRVGKKRKVRLFKNVILEISIEDGCVIITGENIVGQSKLPIDFHAIIWKSWSFVAVGKISLKSIRRPNTRWSYWTLSRASTAAHRVGHNNNNQKNGIGSRSKSTTEWNEWPRRSFLYLNARTKRKKGKWEKWCNSHGTNLIKRMRRKAHAKTQAEKSRHQRLGRCSKGKDIGAC